jgi:hypothetical protein
MNGLWTKILTTVIGALILALQGTNVIQGAAIQSTETRVQGTEERIEGLEQSIAEKIVANQEKYFKEVQVALRHLDEIEKRLPPLPSPTPAK